MVGLVVRYQFSVICILPSSLKDQCKGSEESHGEDLGYQFRAAWSANYLLSPSADSPARQERDLVFVLGTTGGHGPETERIRSFHHLCLWLVPAPRTIEILPRVFLHLFLGIGFVSFFAESYFLFLIQNSSGLPPVSISCHVLGTVYVS